MRALKTVFAEWIRNVGIPIAAGLGLATDGELNEAFGADKAAMTGKIIKNFKKIWALGDNPWLVARTPEEVAGIQKMAARSRRTYHEFERMPQAAYSNVNDVDASLETVVAPQFGHPKKGEFVVNDRIARVYALHGGPQTAWHEMIHGAQYAHGDDIAMLEDLADRIHRWSNDNTVLSYYYNPKEVMARGMAFDAVETYGHLDAIPDDLFERLYRLHLDETVRFADEILSGRPVKARDFPNVFGKAIRAVAIGSTVGAALAMMPDAAEAMPRGVYRPIAETAKTLERSSAAAKLVGREIAPGKVVADVLKSKGRERILRFKDGTESTVTAKDVSYLSRSAGTADQLKKFEEADEASKLTQALRSMSFHEVRAVPAPKNKRAVSEYLRRYREHLREMEAEVPDTVIVSRGDLIYSMPRPYAELLSDQGILRIVSKPKTPKNVEPPK